MLTASQRWQAHLALFHAMLENNFHKYTIALRLLERDNEDRRRAGMFGEPLTEARALAAHDYEAADSLNDRRPGETI